VSFFSVVKILKGTVASPSRCKLRKVGSEIIEEIDKMLIGWSSASGS
jgi:hypothetical protein